MMENVHKYIIVVDTSLPFDRAKVEQFSAGDYIVLSSRHRDVVIADYGDLICLLIEWRSK